MRPCAPRRKAESHCQASRMRDARLEILPTHARGPNELESTARCPGEGDPTGRIRNGTLTITPRQSAGETTLRLNHQPAMQITSGLKKMLRPPKRAAFTNGSPTPHFL